MIKIARSRVVDIENLTNILLLIINSCRLRINYAISFQLCFWI